MTSIKRITIGGAILMSSLLMVSACSSVSDFNRTPGANTLTTGNIIGGSSSTTTDGQDAKTIVLELKSLAKSGETDNFPFTAGKSSITQVKQKWGQPDTEDVVGDGTYVTYNSKQAAFGFNQNGTIFDVRSYSQRVQSLSLSDVRTVLGDPKLTTIPTATQINDIYQVNNTYQLEFTINTNSNTVDHISVFDGGAVDSQANPHGSITSSGVAIRGVIEGFYGTPWSNQERINMFQFMQKENLNTYVYAPKNDPYQRLDWRTKYPSSQLLQMKTLVQTANHDHINFVYSISPGMTGLTASEINDSITYSSAMDRANLESKIDQLRSIGVDTFALSFDDILTKLKPADQSVYGTSYMKAQMDLANAVYAYEKSKDPNFQLWFVPTSYYGLVDGPYWQTLRSKLNQSIQVFWTGKWVLNQTITTSQVQTITNLLGRKPIIWDNYPVNDYTYVQYHAPELFMGPFEGRDVTLPNAISGYLSNPMIQPYASKLSLMTLSMYLQNPKSYNPVSAWNEAIQKMPGITNPSLFKEFAIYATQSKVDSNGLSPMNALSSAYRNAKTPASKKQAGQNMYDEFKQLSNLPKTLPPTITDKVLLNEIQPWLTKLGEEGQGGLDALAVINQPNQTSKQQLASQIKLVTASPYKIGSDIITFMQWAENQ